MNAARNKTDINCCTPTSGYVSSVVLALLLSGVLTRITVALMGPLGMSLPGPDRVVAISSALFLGIVFANPVDTARGLIRPVRALRRFALGLVGGYGAQILFITPLVGNGLSRWVLLLGAIAAIPLMRSCNRLRAWMRRNGLGAENIALWLANRPNMVWFLGIMGLSFWLFLRLAPSFTGAITALAVIVIGITVSAAINGRTGEHWEDPEKARLQAWLALEQDDEISPREQLQQRLGEIVGQILPGAVLFGGTARVAADFVMLVYPDLGARLGDDWASAARALAIAAASGLGAVLFGLMAALGLSLAVLRLIARLRGWRDEHRAESMLRVARMMYFRPLRRG